MSDTIYALATSPGRSGVAIIRLSGPHALPALKRLTGLDDITPRQAVYASLRASTGDIIDKGLALYFPAPRSFTGEDVVELHIHGSLAVIRELLGALSQQHGLRPAEQGEFSRRAFINGKMDLIEAEGLADLIDAETTAQKTQAMRQMQGELSGYYDSLRTGIIQSLAHLEAYIDFPDEDIPESVLQGLEGQIRNLQSVMEQGLQDHKRGERLREGLHVVILGAPNAGKSSLLNAIARRDAAIVSARAGTTRDVIEIHMDMAGFPVILVDTAGLRETSDDIEEEGVRRALARAGEADIKLVLADGTQWPEMDAASKALLDNQSMLIFTKADMLEKGMEPADGLSISTQTGQGMDNLLAELEKRIIRFFSGETAPFITRARHRALLSESLKHLQNCHKKAELELKCEELRLAANAVGKITGKIQVDDVLDVIFRQFCIGK